MDVKHYFGWKGHSKQKYHGQKNKIFSECNGDENVFGTYAYLDKNYGRTGLFEIWACDHNKISTMIKHG